VRLLQSVGVVLHPRRDSTDAVRAILGWAHGRRLAVEVDGSLAGAVGPGETVDVDQSDQHGKVVRLGTTTFSQRVRRKLRLTDPAELDAAAPVTGAER
jgi:hypothetical protein